MNELMHRNLELLEQLAEQDKLLAAVPVEAIRELMDCVVDIASCPYPLQDLHAQLYDNDVATVRTWLDSLEARNG